jgi:hypothetical protein
LKPEASNVDIAECEEQDEGQRSNRAQAGARPQQLRQLCDVGGDAPGLVAGEQLGRRAPTGVILEID